MIFQDRLFHGVHLQLQPGHQRQVVLYDLLQKIIEEAFQTGSAPAACAPDGLHNGFRGSRIVDEDDALFIQREGELYVFRIEILPVRDAERSREGIVVYLRVSGEDLGILRFLDVEAEVYLRVSGEDLGILRFLDVEAEIELFFLCAPCGMA